jgi:hypothetical protein
MVLPHPNLASGVSSLSFRDGEAIFANTTSGHCSLLVADIVQFVPILHLEEGEEGK